MAKPTLAKKIALSVLGAAVITLSAAGQQYEKSDGNTFKKGLTRYNQIVEYKDGDKIRYVRELFGHDLDKVIINGNKYGPKDSKIYCWANMWYNYLLEEAQSQKDMKKELREGKRLAKNTQEAENYSKIIKSQKDMKKELKKRKKIGKEKNDLEIISR